MTDRESVEGRIQGAVEDGVLSPESASLLSGHLGPVVVAGAAGYDVENLTASDVTLVTLLVDQSSSIAGRDLEDAVRGGQSMLVDSMAASREREGILVALWTFDDAHRALHSYVPVEQATRLDRTNYRSTGSTALYDTWCDALASNVAYAQQLRDAGTLCRSVVVVVTDGEDTSSKRTAGECARLSKDLLASEQFVLAFVGVGPDANFRAVARSMGIPDGSILEEKATTTSALRSVFQMVSQSTIRASQGRIQPGPSVGFFGP
jgi:uncharacterized protein YegL